MTEQTPLLRLFQGADAQPVIDPMQRGIAYGDGLFETMRVHQNQIHWWPQHWQRLQRGAARLQLALPAQALVLAHVNALLADAPSHWQQHGVLKLLLSRSHAGRGYAPHSAQCDWQLALHPAPAPTPAAGLQLRWCHLRLAAQPALAGIKHCNRLEQVLARAEWAQLPHAQAGADEGLLCDTQGHLISAIAANVFVYLNDGWHTPQLDSCGVEGICRQWALTALNARQGRLFPEQLSAAKAVFLCNAVRGLMPVARLQQQSFAIDHPAMLDAQSRLRQAHPAFA